MPIETITNPPQDPAQLAPIEHVVVLMMENRSFDHMLGFLTLAGRTDVDGLTGAEVNEHAGRPYPVHHLDRTAYPKPLDPCHGAQCVADQIAGGTMGGFVGNFVAKNCSSHDAARSFARMIESASTSRGPSS